MGLPRFGRPKNDDESSSNLFVANCGPAVGHSDHEIASVFSKFGELNGVYAADDSGTRVIVSFSDQGSAQSAFKALHGQPCHELGGRTLHIRYSVLQPNHQDHVKDLVPVSITASDLNIPGVYLVHDFITAQEEEELLQAVDCRPWNSLAKRRVQHYGYEFRYDTRNVNTKHCLGELPSFVSPVLERISSCPTFKNTDDSIVLDQLTIDKVNGRVIRRASRRVSFTFRKVREGLCKCEFPQYCDSQR